MIKTERDKIKNKISKNQNSYIDLLGMATCRDGIEKRMENLRNKISRFVRTEYASKNSLKQIPNLSRIIFGLQEDMKRLHIVEYDFREEKELLNNYLIYTLNELATTKYNRKCPSYGEALLNCYLDLFITFTSLKTDKEIGTNPDFLVNPLTGANLELDVLFEGYKLAFEFQGEHHYLDANVMSKDLVKLSECKNTNRILIPVNICQLNNEKLSVLILNSIKEQVGLNKIVNDLDFEEYKNVGNSKRNLYNFFKATQRNYLAQQLFFQTLNWLDSRSFEYISSIQVRSPISATTDAPRLMHEVADLDVECIYKRIPLIRKGCA